MNPQEIDMLREVFAYDPWTGHFTWKVNTNRSSIGKRAGGLHGNTKRRILSYNHKNYTGKFVAWAFVHGECRKNIVTKDGDEDNLAIGNLMIAVKKVAIKTPQGPKKVYRNDVDFCSTKQDLLGREW